MTTLKFIVAVITVSLLAVLAMGTAPALAAKKQENAAEASGPQPEYSKAFIKRALKVQKDVEEGNWAKVREALVDLEALQELTADDKKMILGWKLQAAQGVGDNQTVYETLERFVTEGYATGEQRAMMSRNLAAWYSGQKNTEKTVYYFRAYVDGTAQPPPGDILTLGNLYLQSGDLQQGIAFLNNYIGAAESAGTSAEIVAFQLLDRAYIETDQQDARLVNLEELVKRYPQPDYYSKVMALYSQAAKDDRVVMLNLYRLALRDVGLATVGEYLNYADHALVLGSPGEAERALRKGMEAGVVPSVGTNQATLQESRAAADEDRKNLPKDAQAAAEDPAGEFAVKVALGFYSIGDWEQAASGVRSGLAKGGVKRVDDANLLLGASLVELGRLEEANAAFDAAAAAAADRYMKGIAGMWKGMVARKQSPAPAEPDSPEPEA